LKDRSIELNYKTRSPHSNQTVVLKKSAEFSGNLLSALMTQFEEEFYRFSHRFIVDDSNVDKIRVSKLCHSTAEKESHPNHLFVESPCGLSNKIDIHIR
jgi:hypothetical protein